MARIVAGKGPAWNIGAPDASADDGIVEVDMVTALFIIAILSLPGSKDRASSCNPFSKKIPQNL